MTKPLDLITIGRSSVDLYGAQIGGRLEDMRSFEKYIGGSPTNIACGTARLGLKSAVITGVGDEHMGRFIVEQLQREGVDTRGVKTDPDRLTALVLLGIRDEEQFPLIFYRENCADMGLTEDDIDEGFVAEARALVVTGTHLSHPRTEAAVLKALRLARENGAQTALDIDYRPNLWGVAGHGEGESRFVASDKVTAKLQATLHHFDLIVGTEEEFHIAGGTTDTLAALRAVRAVSAATLVCKRGAAGAVAFTGPIPDSLDDGQAGPGFPIEVFNVLGAGDGFMSGLLKGWLDSRRGPRTGRPPSSTPTPAAPSPSPATAARPPIPPGPSSSSSSTAASATPPFARTPSSNRCTGPPTAPATGPRCASSPSTTACRWRRWRAPRPTGSAPSRPSASVPPNASRAAAPATASSATAAWGARRSTAPPAPASGSAAPSNGPAPARWNSSPRSAPTAAASPNGPPTTSSSASASATPTTTPRPGPTRSPPSPVSSPPPAATVWSSCSRSSPRRSGRSTTTRRRPSSSGSTTPASSPTGGSSSPSAPTPPGPAPAPAITRNDPNTRGVVVLGLDAPAHELQASFARAARHPLVKGFAVGRTIFGDAARAWMAGEIDDEAAVTDMAEKFASLADTWDRARAEGREQAA